MAAIRPNPFDGTVESLAAAMEDIDNKLAGYAEGVRPFDSQQLTPEEDELLFDNPSLRYPGEINPDTGMPFSNDEATIRFRSEVGDEEYVRYNEDHVRRRDRRAKSRAEMIDKEP